MNKLVVVCIMSLAILFGNQQNAKSQCEPDRLNCVDINEPGQICPAQLANGFIGAEYEEVITIIAPDVANIDDVQIDLLKITLDSIQNLPPGLEFHGETNEFFPDEFYCVTVSGTPTETGTFYLKIYVMPYVDFFGADLPMGTQIDSLSVSITIEESSGIKELDDDGFALINAYPNPFQSSTRIGFLEPDHGEAELRVMDMLGKEIFHERIVAVKGENYFQFNGDNLPPGYYIYAILREQKSFKGKLLKRK